MGQGPPYSGPSNPPSELIVRWVSESDQRMARPNELCKVPFFALLVNPAEITDPTGPINAKGRSS